MDRGKKWDTGMQSTGVQLDNNLGLMGALKIHGLRAHRDTLDGVQVRYNG